MLMLTTTMLMMLYIMGETHWYILNHLILIQNLVKHFSRIKAFAITNMIRIAYVDVANHNCDIAVAVDFDGDPLIQIK